MSKSSVVRLGLGLLIGAYILGGLILSGHSPVLALVESVKQGLRPSSLSTPSPTPANSQLASEANQTPASKSQSAKSGEDVGSKNQPLAKKPQSIGIFVANSPDDPAAFGVLDQVSALGFNTIYNYSSFHSSPESVRKYLDHAQARGLKVIFSLKDLYDQLPSSEQWPQNFGYYGSSNEEIALSVVRQFKDHPATWGFSISDEAPEEPAQLSSWQQVLSDRYQKIKSISNKPVMMVLVGHTSPSQAVRRTFLSSLKGARDNFALDYYPVPFESPDNISSIAADMTAVGDGNGWFVAQCFSWSSYPSTAQGLGYNSSIARLPTADEMYSMAKTALNSGARNIMFYSYFDIKDNPAQLAALKSAVSRLR